MRPDIVRLFVWMTVFFIAMAFLESAVVVYLRALYYPEGFDFPLVPMDASLVNTEVLREFATLVMLLVPGALVTRSAMERFAWFCYGFGIWDIFYYVWLKVLLNWPSGLDSRDLLFLIPVPWVGPVWAPCLVSLGLIVLAIAILWGRSVSTKRILDGISWIALIIGALVIIASFTLDPVLNSFGIQGLVDPQNLSESRSSALIKGRDYIPTSFPWHLFLIGCTIGAYGIIRCFIRTAKGR